MRQAAEPTALVEILVFCSGGRGKRYLPRQGTYSTLLSILRYLEHLEPRHGLRLTWSLRALGDGKLFGE